MADIGDEGAALPALTTDDIDFIEGEPRITDVRLASFLGYSEVRKLRDLAERHRESLERFGGISAHGGRKIDDGIFAHGAPKIGRGRPSKGMAFNMKQALFLGGKTDLPAGVELLIRMVEVFEAVMSRRAPAPSLPAAPVPPFCAACRAADLWRRGINSATDPNALVDRPLSGADLRVLKVIRQLIDQEVDSVLSLRSLRATAAVIRILRGEELTGGGDA